MNFTVFCVTSMIFPVKAAPMRSKLHFDLSATSSATWKTPQRLEYKRNIIYYFYNHIIPSLISKLKMQDIKNNDCSYQ